MNEHSYTRCHSKMKDRSLVNMVGNLPKPSCSKFSFRLERCITFTVTHQSPVTQQSAQPSINLFFWNIEIDGLFYFQNYILRDCCWPVVSAHLLLKR